MKVKYCIVILPMLFLLNGCNRSYRIQNVNINSKNVEFILPPFSKLTKEEKGKYILNKKFRFHYISFNFQGNYIESLEDLNEFEYKISKESHLGRNSQQCDSKNSCQYKVTNNSFQIEFDYQTLSNGEVINNFSTLPIDLLKKLATEEKNNSWPKSIAQNIVEKVFEILPVPQETVLARYGAILDNDKSFTLLNPNLLLLLDNTLFQNNPNSWYFSLNSQSRIRLYRNDNGDIKQSEFINKINTTNSPNNIFKKDGQVTNLASSVDIQLSNGTTSKKYIGLYHPFFKRNSSASTYGPDSCEDVRDNPSLCNSVLVLSDNLEDIYNCINQSNIDNCKNINIASYGNRNLITPLQLIYIDTYPFEVTFNSKIYNLVYPYMFSKKFKVKRLYNRKYFSLKNFSQDTIVLPGDEFRRKL